MYIYFFKRQGFKRVLPRTRTVNIIFCLFRQHGVCYLVEILDFSTLTLLYTHCDKNYLNLCIKKKKFHGWRGSVIFCVTICISGQKNSHTVHRYICSSRDRLGFFVCFEILGYFWPELAVMISQHKSFCSALYPATQISIKSFRDRFSMEINIDINANLFFQILLKSGQHYPLLLLHFLYFMT